MAPGMDGMALADWAKVVNAASDQLAKLHGLSDSVLLHTKENSGEGAMCVLVDSGRTHSALFVSRSLEQYTGHAASQAVGRGHLDFLSPPIAWLDDLFNGTERKGLLDFYDLVRRGSPRSPKDEIGNHICVSVCCTSKGHPFWCLVNSLVVKVPAKDTDHEATKYILNVLVPLQAPVPDTVWITEAGEARLAAKASAEQVKPFVDQVHQDIRIRMSGATALGLVPIAERRCKAFSELLEDAFLGTRFVPRLGREAAAEFESLGLREEVFEALEAALKKAWEASDEVYKNTAAGFAPRGSAALACAVSDPCHQDCPLVYISSGFEELTGFRASWCLGRNCRFLQPQQCGNAPSAINRREAERMHDFCKARSSGSILSLLLNESADGKFFWNLLFMQHLFLNHEDNHGVSRHYIFAVQTEIRTPNLRQLILQAWDMGAGEYRLTRLRELLQARERAFNPRQQSLLALCDEVFGQWMQEVGGQDRIWNLSHESAAAIDDFAQQWPALFEASSATLKRIFRMGEQDLRDMKANMPGGIVCCVSDPSGKDCPLVFISKGFEEMTGYTPGDVLGKNCRFLQPSRKNMNHVVNGDEKVRLRAFCELAGQSAEKEALVCLLLNERKTGERFWNLLHMHRFVVEGKVFILAVQSILQVPLPAQLRVEREMTPDEAAEHDRMSEQLGQLMRKVRPLLAEQGCVDMHYAVQVATSSIKSFLQSCCPDYEGDHWVPCLGMEEANLFERDMLWKRAFEEMSSSLKKIWEVSQGSEEDVAIAISDPKGRDCPLVYVSNKFEDITGYDRNFAIGRNCRFLQPNVSWCNSFFNREECRRMHSFCEDTLPRGSRIVALLVNEHKSRYPFLNLLVMEHIEVPMPRSTREPGAPYQKLEHKPFIFGVQTSLDSQTNCLMELLTVDRESQKQLDRLRQVLRSRESSLRFQSLTTFARECIAEWLPNLPQYFAVPRVRLGAPPGWRRAAVPAVGLEVTAQNLLEAVPQALEEGVRHFYLTFQMEDRGIHDSNTRELQGRLLALRLTELLNMMVPGFFHYLRSNISFTLVTPPASVGAYEEVAQALHAHRYLLDCWMLDLRSDSSRWDTQLSEYWKLMCGIRMAGGVGNVGILGGGSDVCEQLNSESSASFVGVLGVEMYPKRKWLEPREKAYFDQQVARGTTIIAYNVFGYRQQLLEAPAVRDEAERLQIDPATLLMKWVEGKGFAMMLPRLRLLRSKRQLRQRAHADNSDAASVCTSDWGGSEVSPASPASPSCPSHGKEQPNFHRTFAKEYSRVLPGAVDDFFRRSPEVLNPPSINEDILQSHAGTWGRQVTAPSKPLGHSTGAGRSRQKGILVGDLSEFPASGTEFTRRRSCGETDVDSKPTWTSSASHYSAHHAAGDALSGAAFDAHGVRSAMRLQQQVAAEGRGKNDFSLAVNKRGSSDLQSLALEFSLKVPEGASSARNPRHVDHKTEMCRRISAGAAASDRRCTGA